MSLSGDVKALPRELRTAGLAALALAFSLVLPWYQKSFFENGKVVQDNLSAFGVFTFVEAAVLLVACAVLFLVWARSQRKAFHLPGGDGVAITVAGAWALLLLVWRLFDKPDISGPGATIGIQWGIFGALLAAGALVAAGARVRAAHRPEPPNPAAEDVDWVAPPPRPAPRPDRRPRDATAVTEALRDRPVWEGEPSDDPARAQPARASRPTPPNDLDDPARAQPARASRPTPPNDLDDPARAQPARASRPTPPNDLDDPARAQPARASRPTPPNDLDDPARAQTTRLPDDDAPTTRLPDDEDPSRARTTRLPRDDEATRRLWEDEEPPPR